MYEIHILLEVAFISGDAVSGYHARFSGESWLESLPGCCFVLFGEWNDEGGRVKLLKNMQ